MAEFKATLKKINGNTPPQDFLETLIRVAKRLLLNEPEVFAVNPHRDIYSSVKGQLGPYTSLNQRASVMLESLRVLASRESSYNWLAGKDPGASNNSAWTKEAGIFQCSSNSMYQRPTLQAFFRKKTGLTWANSRAVGERFQALTKTDNEFAVEYAMKLFRLTTSTHGPITSGLIHRDLSRDAALEFESFLGATEITPKPEPEIVISAPPRPRNYDEVYRIFGNPRESSWAKNNLRFCQVDSRFTEMPLVNSKRGFYCHKLLVGVFQKCFAEIAAAGLWENEFYSWEGCYNLRNISGSTRLSLHSWAIAIDFNYAGNEYGDRTPSMDKRIVSIMKRNGFDWGGDFTGKVDGMHFEYLNRRG